MDFGIEFYIAVSVAFLILVFFIIMAVIYDKYFAKESGEIEMNGKRLVRDENNAEESAVPDSKYTEEIKDPLLGDDLVESTSIEPTQLKTTLV